MNSPAAQIIAFVSRFATAPNAAVGSRKTPAHARFTLSIARRQAGARPAHSGLMTLQAIHERNDACAEIVDFEWAYASGCAARLLGHEPRELVGRRLLDLFEGEPAKVALLRHYKAVVERGGAEEAEHEHALAGSLCRYCHAAVRLGDGVVVTLTNLTAARETALPRLDSLALYRAADQRSGVALSGK